MNATNRGANRALILVVGVMLLAAGGTLLAVVSLPTFRESWARVAPLLLRQAETLARADGRALLLAVVLAILLAIVVLLIFEFRQGGGRTSLLVSAPSTANGRTEVSARVAQDALEEYLASRPEFVASHVSTYLVKRHPTLKISATCRRGVSPRDALVAVRSGVDALDLVLGIELPALLQLSGGFRTRLTRTTRIG